MQTIYAGQQCPQWVEADLSRIGGQKAGHITFEALKENAATILYLLSFGG